MPTKQKNGLYRTKLTIGRDANGKPIYKYISGRTKKELEEARQYVLSHYVNGVCLPSDQLFGTYCTRWFQSRILPSLSKSTLQSYRHMLNKYVLPAFGDRNLRSITSLDIQEWLNGFAGYSSSTIALAATVVRGVFRSALSDQLLQIDPTVQLLMPKASKSVERRALTEEETQRLLPLMDSTRDGQYLAVLYYLGLRPGEARGLQWGDFNWEERTVHIQRDIDYAAHGEVGELKTQAANRHVPVPQELYALLYPSRGLPGAFLFCGVRSGRPLNKTSARTLWLRLMLRAGLAEKRDTPSREFHVMYTCYLTPYYLRHNYITMCWQAGVDPLIVQRIVGHRDYRTTANVYTHLNNMHISRARDCIESVFAEQSRIAAENKVAKKLHDPLVFPSTQQ